MRLHAGAQFTIVNANMSNHLTNGLFITHDVSNYGASRSLQLLLRNSPDIQIGLIIKKLLGVPSANDDDIRNRFGREIRDIWRMYLPFDDCYVDRPVPSLQWFADRNLRKLMWMLTNRELYRLVNERAYDFIHLNSLVLHPIIRKEHPFIIHIREIYDGCNKATKQSIQNAAGVIFIDETTARAFADTHISRAIVLNNPIDMIPIRSLREQDIEIPGVNYRENVIFSIIGIMTEKKGVDFVIRCFRNIPNKNARLLVVGKSSRKYYGLCKRVAQGDPRIVFWGEEPDIMKIYAVSDYILRGEESQCVGRTVYEGLYAGCSVIIPAYRDKLQSLFEYDAYRESIHAYRPRDKRGLTSLMNQLSSTKIGDRVYRSNVTDYVKRFHSFIGEAVVKFNTKRG